MASNFASNAIYVSPTQQVQAAQTASYVYPNPIETGIFTYIPLWENRLDPEATIQVTINPGDAPIYAGGKSFVVSSGSILLVE